MRQFIYCVALCSVTMLAGMVRADDITPSDDPMTVTIEREPVNTVDPIYRAYVSVEGDKFTFLVPSGYRASGDPAKGKLQFRTAEGNGVISFVFLSSASGNISSLSPEARREYVTDHYPKGKIVSEFSHPAAGHPGNGYDVEWTGASGFAQKTRALFFSTKVGLVEVTITTGIKNFPAAQADLNGFLTTFTESGLDGKLQVSRMGNVN